MRMTPTISCVPSARRNEGNHPLSSTCCSVQQGDTSCAMPLRARPTGRFPRGARPSFDRDTATSDSDYRRHKYLRIFVKYCEDGKIGGGRRKLTAAVVLFSACRVLVGATGRHAPRQRLSRGGPSMQQNRQSRPPCFPMVFISAGNTQHRTVEIIDEELNVIPENGCVCADLLIV